MRFGVDRSCQLLRARRQGHDHRGQGARCQHRPVQGRPGAGPRKQEMKSSPRPGCGRLRPSTRSAVGPALLSCLRAQGITDWLPTTATLLAARGSQEQRSPQRPDAVAGVGRWLACALRCFRTLYRLVFMPPRLVVAGGCRLQAGLNGEVGCRCSRASQRLSCSLRTPQVRAPML